MSEYWVETNISTLKASSIAVVKLIYELQANIENQKIECEYFHFLYEARGWMGNDEEINPHIRYRIQLRDESSKKDVKKIISSWLDNIGIEYYFGRHGRKDEEYIGEIDRFGETGWELTKTLLEACNLVAIGLIEHKHEGPRFCEPDLLHLITNILNVQHFSLKNPTMTIIFKEEDLPKETKWEGA